MRFSVNPSLQRQMIRIILLSSLWIGLISFTIPSFSALHQDPTPECSEHCQDCPKAGIPDEDEVRALKNAAYGTIPLTIPAGTPTVVSSNANSVQIAPQAGDDTERIQNIMDNLCDGSDDCNKTIYFQKGVYQIAELDLKRYHHLTFIGEQGAIFSGKANLPDWELKKGADGQTPAHTFVHPLKDFGGMKSENSVCEKNAPCGTLQDLFREQWWITEIRPQDADKMSAFTEWYYLDDRNDTDPNNDVIVYHNKNIDNLATLAASNLTLSNQSTAFAYSKATHVTVRNIEFREYTKSAFTARDHYTVEHCIFRNNHHTGLGLGGENVAIKYNKSINNGKTGMEGSGSVNAKVHHNELAYNNQARFNKGHHAGGMKTTRTVNLHVYENYVHDNIGPGLWTDVYCEGTKYYRNYVTNTTPHKLQRIGIFYELSKGDAPTLGGSDQRADWDIYENLVENQASIAIKVSNSAHVEVYHNTLRRNTRGVALLQDARTIEGSCRPGDPRTVPDCTDDKPGVCESRCDRQIYNVTVHYNHLVARASDKYRKLAELEVVCNSDGVNRCSDDPAVQNRFYTTPYRVSFDYNRYALAGQQRWNGEIACLKERTAFGWGWNAERGKVNSRAWSEWTTHHDQHSCVCPPEPPKQSEIVRPAPTPTPAPAPDPVAPPPPVIPDSLIQSLPTPAPAPTPTPTPEPTDGVVTAIAPEQVAAAVQVYPVPFQQVLHMVLEDAINRRQTLRVQLIDPLGRVTLIKANQLRIDRNKLTITTPGIPPGPYHLMVYHNGKTYRARVAKW